MLEQCKEIVHKFNAVYGDTLVDPQIILPKNQACLRLPGIDGKAKMSKSLGNCIYLSDSPEDIRTKVMSMFTDPTHLRREDPGHTEGNPVFIYLDAFCRPEYFPEFLPEYSGLDELKAHYQRGGLGDVKVKKFLNNVLQAELAPIRQRREDWEKRLPDVYEILRTGSETARNTAASTLRDVRHAMRIDYFEDNNLLREMAKATIRMVTESVDAYVKCDTMLAEQVIAEDDTVDGYFTQVKERLIGKIAQDPADGEYALDLLMIAKYFERIGDHATNIAEWVIFSVTGVHKGE